MFLHIESPDEFFFSLIEDKGYFYKEFVKELKLWKATVNDLKTFTEMDFRILGLGQSRSAIRKGVLRLLNSQESGSTMQVPSLCFYKVCAKAR